MLLATWTKDLEKCLNATREHHMNLNATDKSLSIRSVEILSDVVDKTKELPYHDVLWFWVSMDEIYLVC